MFMLINAQTATIGRHTTVNIEKDFVIFINRLEASLIFFSTVLKYVVMPRSISILALLIV